MTGREPSGSCGHQLAPWIDPRPPLLPKFMMLLSFWKKPSSNLAVRTSGKQPQLPTPSPSPATQNRTRGPIQFLYSSFQNLLCCLQRTPVQQWSPKWYV